MAGIAGIRSVDVIRRLAGGFDSVVAARARRRHVRVVEGCRYPRGGRMAIVAIVTACDVRSVLACCRIAIVTGEAGAENLAVIYERNRVPGDGVMAVLADICSPDMSGMPARGVNTVVAAEAAAGDICMVEGRRCPCARLVAVIAPVTGDDVSRRLARCVDAVVTVVTAAGHGRMIHECQR